MKEALKTVIADATETVNKSVTLSLQSKIVRLNGTWNWELHSSAIYCSDVMFFPEDVTGTSGIIHPDDLSKVLSALVLLEERELPVLDFRMITTYGEVKKISGQRVSIAKVKNEFIEPVPGKEPWEEALELLVSKKENSFLQLRKELFEYTERLYGIGSWLLNKESGEVWYSDNVFRIHGMAPQSLNAHANTFNQFIHREDRITVLDAFEKAYKEQVPLHVEYRIVLHDGETRFIQQITRWVFTPDGQNVISGIVRDVTLERNIADELLAAQSQSLMYQQVLKLADQQASSGFWLMNLSTRKTSYSENYYRIYGFKQSYLPSYNSFLNLVHSEDRRKVNELIDKMYNEHSLPETEFRIIRPDGKLRYLRQSGRLFISANKDLYLIGVVQDISVQKSLEQNILELNEKASLNHALMEMVENTMEAASFMWLPDGYMQWSNAFYRMLGYKPGGIEPIPRIVYRNIHPDDLKTFKDAEALLLNHQHHDDIVIRMVSKGGIRKVKLSFQQLDFEKQVIIALVRDVSREIQFNEEIQQSQSFAGLIEDSVNDMIVFTNVDHTILHWNKTAEEKTNIKKEEALHHNLFEIIPRLNEGRFFGELQSALKGNEGHSSRVQDVYFRASHDYWLWPLKNEEGAVRGVLHVVHDVSRQLQLQQQLSERLNFIESLVESSVDRIVVLDRFMNYLYWNKKAEQYYAIRKERVLGKNILEIFPAFRNDPDFNEFRKVLKGETVYLPSRVNGEADEYFETYLIPIKDEGGEVNAVLWIVHDLSREWQLQIQRKKAEEEAQEKTESLKRSYSVLNAIREACFELDSKGTVVFVNKQAVEWWEMKEDEVVGKNIWDIFPETNTSNCYDAIQINALDNKLHAQFEYLSAVLNKWIHLHATPTETGCIVVFRDIDERKKAEQEVIRLKDRLVQKAKDEYLNLFNTIDEAFALCEALRNPDGRLIDYRFAEVNPAFEKHMNIQRSDLIGHLRNEVLPEDPSALQMYEGVLSSGKPFHVEHFSAELNKWFSVSIYPREGDKFAVLFDDITQRKKSEQQLKTFSTELEHQVGERAKNLVQKNEDLQKSLTLLSYTEYFAETGNWEYEIATGNLNWSEGMYTMFGLPPRTKTFPETYLDFVVDEDRAVAKRIVNFLKKKHQPFEEVIRIKRNGDVRTIKIKASIFADGKGQAQKIIGVNIDITNIQRTEEKLKESQHWLNQMAKASPDSITVYDLQKKQPAYLNNCLGEWLETGSCELVQMGVEGRLKLIHPDDRLKVLHFNETVVSSGDGDISTIEYRIRTANDKLLWLRNRSKIFQRDHEGRVTHILSILQDVTEEITLREELKQRTQFAESILEASTNRITVFDRNYRFIAWNKRCEEIHGVKKTEAIGKTIFEMFPGVENYPLFADAQEKSLSGEYVHLPCVQDTHTGTYLELFYVPLKNEWGETYAVLNIMHDVSTYVKQTEALNGLNNKLEAQKAELEQKNEEITHFSFVASHDMKEPLRKIHTFSDWLLDQESTQLSPKGKSLVEKINSSVKRMNLLIDDILVLTKIHSDTHMEGSVDLNKVLRNVMEDSSDLIRQTQTEIRSDHLPPIRGNDNQLFYLFKNLIANAIKFQKPGNVPRIIITAEVIAGNELKPHEGKDAWLKLAFIDNGFGFDRRYVKKIFQVFQRLHGKHEYEGTGIGLAICKKIMENHGGMITAETEEGKGSTFICYFPLQ